MPPNSAPCLTRSTSRSPPSLPTAPTTRIEVYDAVAEHSAEAAVVVPPRATAVLSPSAETDPTQRDRHIQAIAEQGRMGWQKTSGYNARAGAEGAMSRYKRIIGDTLRSHTRPAQEVETRIAVTVLNRMFDLGRPNSVRAA